MAVNERGPGGDQEDARIARLYREAPVEEPPARLDAAVRAAARSAVEPRAPATAASWWTPWRVPFAVAAVAVVSASLVTLVMEERGSEVGVGPPPLTRADEEPAGQRSNAPAWEGAGEKAPLDDSRRLPAPEPRPAPAASDALGKRSEGAPRFKVLRDEAMPQEPQRQESVAVQPPGETGQRSASEFRVPAAAPARERAAMPAAPSAAATKRAAPDVTSQSTDEIAGLKAELDSEPPLRWLERIRALRAEGRRTEADALLAEFKRRYPEHQVPDSLQ